MLFADIDWTAFFNALTAFLVIAATVVQSRWLQKKNAVVEAKVTEAASDAKTAASDAKTAAETAEAQARTTNREITAVHSTLNGTGILGTLRDVAERQAQVIERQDRIERMQVAHEVEDRTHFTKTDEALEVVVKEVKDIHAKVATVVERGIVIEPKSPEAS